MSKRKILWTIIGMVVFAASILALVMVAKTKEVPTPPPVFVR